MFFDKECTKPAAIQPGDEVQIDVDTGTIRILHEHTELYWARNKTKISLGKSMIIKSSLSHIDKICKANNLKYRQIFDQNASILRYKFR
ncbi:hypothetical protein COB55_00705 [Candidatus Wolfebacteria bacterium]|nr:MAG: hypothetical protein COB55_00705 [Candidatus Wolfebacteria bacterium]